MLRTTAKRVRRRPSASGAWAKALAMRAFIRRALVDQAGNAAYDHVLDAVAKSTIAEALEMTSGNRTRAAKLLGLSRPTLIAKIEKYGLKVITQVQ